MSRGIAEVLQEFLHDQGLDEVWIGAAVMEVWPEVVGARYAARVEPIFARSAIEERGLLTVAVPNSAWMHEVSFLNIADRLNRALGGQRIKQVRFEVRGIPR